MIYLKKAKGFIAITQDRQVNAGTHKQHGGKTVQCVQRDNEKDPNNVSLLLRNCEVSQMLRKQQKGQPDGKRAKSTSN